VAGRSGTSRGLERRRHVACGGQAFLARVRFGHVEEELRASAGSGRVTGDQRLGNVLVVG